MSKQSIPAAAEALPKLDVIDIQDKLLIARQTARVLGLCGEGLLSRMTDEANAIVMVADQIANLLEAISDDLDSALDENDASTPVTPMPMIDNTPIFEPAKLSLDGLFSLHEALRTVSEVLSGFGSQPRFTESRSRDLLPEGDMLQSLEAFIDGVLEDLYEEAITRRPVSKRERERKFYFIADRYVDGLTSPEAAIAAIGEKVSALGGVA